MPRMSAVVIALLSGLVALSNDLSSEAARLFVWDGRVRTFSGLAELTRSAPFPSGMGWEHPDTEPGVTFYRPIAAAVDWLAWQLVRGSAPAQHAIDLGLHALCAALVVQILLERGTTRGAAATMGLAFAAHPAVIHTVAPNAGRPILVGMAITLAAIVWEKRLKAPAACALVAIATVAAGLAHGMFVAAPVLFAGIALGTSRRRAAMIGGSSALPALLTLDVTRYASAMSGGAGVAPRRLMMMFGVAEPALAFTPSASAAWLLVAMLIAAVPVVVLFRMNRPLSLASAGSAFAIAALVMGAAPDWNTYPILVGAALALGPLLDLLPPELRARPYLAFAPPLMALVLVPFNWSNAVAWRNDATLLASTERAVPDDPEGRLAGALLHQGDDLVNAAAICADYASSHRGRSTRADGCVARAALFGGSRTDALEFAQTYVSAQRDHDGSARRLLVEALLANDRVEEAAKAVDGWSARFPGAPDLAAARQAIAKRRAP